MDAQIASSVPDEVLNKVTLGWKLDNLAVKTNKQFTEAHIYRILRQVQQVQPIFRPIWGFSEDPVEYNGQKIALLETLLDSCYEYAVDSLSERSPELNKALKDV